MDNQEQLIPTTKNVFVYRKTQQELKATHKQLKNKFLWTIAPQEYLGLIQLPLSEEIKYTKRCIYIFMQYIIFCWTLLRETCMSYSLI